MCYGPRQVVVIAGMNKVLGTLDDAIARARNIAAPAKDVYKRQVLGDGYLPAVEIIPKGAYFDYESKYQINAT